MLSVSTVLDQPVWNQPLPDADGADLHPDACLARARLVVEVDSIEWHRLGDRVEATETAPGALRGAGLDGAAGFTTSDTG